MTFVGNPANLVITDILIHKGKKLDCNIINRFNTLYDMLTNDYNKNHDLDICPLIVKKLFKEYRPREKIYDGV